MSLTVEEYPCIMHTPEKIAVHGPPQCGPTWFQFSAHGHTLGGCSTPTFHDDGKITYTAWEGKHTAKVETDHKTGQITLLLLSKGKPVAVLGVTPPPGPDVTTPAIS